MPSYDDGSTHPPANAFDPRFLELLGERDEPPTAREAATPWPTSGSGRRRSPPTRRNPPRRPHRPLAEVGELPALPSSSPAPRERGAVLKCSSESLQRAISPPPPAVVAWDYAPKARLSRMRIALRKEICFKPPVTTGFSQSISSRLLRLV